MNSGLSGNLLLLGKVIRPHGLEGLLRVWSYARSEASFLQAGEVILRPVSGNAQPYRVLSARPHKNILLMQLEGVHSLEQAEGFRGAEVLVSPAALSREEGEYFWHELLGLKVFLDTGEYVGVISQIIPAGSNEIYVVGSGEKEIFIPATYEVVRKIDLENETMTISAMEGLLDLNEV
ncbi:MAG: 16S rRNA processing protein RimM [Deltaproteobacteria bacterium]|nr:16S rRNA processing protein RimM [Deltaproteobacteria bacterium]